MNTNIIRHWLLAAIITAGAGTAAAQQGQGQGQGAKDIEPGSKGALPEVAAPAQLGEKQFKGLSLSDVDRQSDGMGGYYNGAELMWPAPEDFGSEWMELQAQTRGSNEWEKVDFYDKLTTGTVVVINTDTRYRLVLVGGEMDGYVSNIVEAKCPVGYTFCYRWGKQQTDDRERIVVGTEYGTTVYLEVWSNMKPDGSFSEEVTKYNIEDGVYNYQWYRRNPNTYEMTAIDGATKRAYTATLDDVGYELIMEITGDNKYCSFTKLMRMGDDYSDNVAVSIPVETSYAYMGDDGFVINCDYALSDPAIVNKDWNDEGRLKPVDQTLIKTRKPGQIAVKLPRETYEGMEFDVADPTLYLCWIMEMPNYNDKGELIGIEQWHRAVQPVSYMQNKPLQVNVKSNGEAVETTVELVGPNIDGEMTTLAMSGTVEGIASFDAFPMDYYVRAVKTDNLVSTYYPSTALRSEAETVKPGLDETFNPVSCDIEMIVCNPAPGDPDGNGVTTVEDVVTLVVNMIENITSPANDTNGDNEFNIADIIALINKLF